MCNVKYGRNNMYEVQLLSMSKYPKYECALPRRGLTFAVSVLMRAFFFGMSLLRAVALYVLSTCLSKAATVRTLRYRPSLFVDMNQRTVCKNPNKLVSSKSDSAEGSLERAC